jgi:hypothetical protein
VLFPLEIELRYEKFACCLKLSAPAIIDHLLNDVDHAFCVYISMMESYSAKRRRKSPENSLPTREKCCDKLKTVPYCLNCVLSVNYVSGDCVLYINQVKSCAASVTSFF